MEYLKTKGFTLIELIVCMAIFAFVTGVVLYNYSQFNTNVLVTNLAYDVGLSIRQAQVFGTSVRYQDTGVGSGFSGSFGIHFDALHPNSLVFFADKPGTGGTAGNDNIYDDALGEKIEERTLTQNYRFRNFCAVPSLGEPECSDNGAHLDYLDISFARPEPDAIIRTSDRAQDGRYQSASVCIASPLGKERKVFIQSTGQISVSSNQDCN